MPFQESDLEYIDELLGSKLTWRVLRILVMYPFLSFRLTDLASKLKTSNKSILRIIRKLNEKGLTLGAVGRHDRYRINPDVRMTRKIWSIFMSERIRRIPQEIVDAIYPYFERIKYKSDAFIISEYPSPDGMLIFKDKADIVVISDRWSSDDIAPIPYSLNVHLFSKQQFSALNHSLIQNALLSGIVLHGEDFVFSLLKSLRSFPQAYIAEKLDNYSRALSQNSGLDEKLQRRQLELIYKNIHIFESQFGVKDDRSKDRPLSERVEKLRYIVDNKNSLNYV